MLNIKEIITHLYYNIAEHTDELTRYLEAEIESASVESDNRTVKVKTSEPHNLENGQIIIVKDGEIRNNVESYSISSGKVIIKTEDVHDYNYERNYDKYIKLEGAGAWSGEYKITNIPDRNRIEIDLPSGSVPSESYIWESRSYGLDGAVEINVIDDNNFSYVIPDENPDLPANEARNITVITGMRITGAADPDRAMKIWSNTGAKETWAFVVMQDEEVSYDRNAMSDALTTADRSDEGRLRLLINFDIIVIQPTESLGATDAVEKANGEIKSALISTLFGIKTRYNAGMDYQFRTAYAGMGVLMYDTARYITVYSFQSPTDITFKNADISDPPSVALREIIYNMYIAQDIDDVNKNSETMNFEKNLDEEA